jgi:hypothetical protein
VSRLLAIATEFGIGAALNRVFLIRMQGLEEIHHSERDEYTERIRPTTVSAGRQLELRI